MHFSSRQENPRCEAGHQLRQKHTITLALLSTVLTCRDQNRLRKMAVSHSEPSITVTAPNLFRKEPLRSVLHVSSCRGAIFQAKFRGSPLCGCELGRDVAADIQPMVRCQPLSDLDSMAALLSSQNKFCQSKVNLSPGLRL